MGVQINGDTGNISATKADYSGNVTIGGTLTYEDVTNIDSVGLVTARSGIEIGARPGVAASISVDGNMVVSGITTIGNTHGGNEKLNVHGAIRSSTSSANFAAGLEGTIMDYDVAGSAARFGHVNGASGSAKAVTFLSGGTEKLRIDSSGRLLLGTTTEGQANADDFTVSSSGDTGITIRSGSSNLGNIYFSDGTSGDAEYRGVVQYEHANDRMNFATSAATRMMIDSSGNVIIGDPSATALDGATVDIRRADNTVYSASAVRANGINIFNTSAVNGGYAGIVLGSTSASGHYGATQLKNVSVADGYSSDFVVQVRNGGTHGEKLRVRSSGGICFNGDTAAANALDDYEEGTWTPTIRSGGGSITNVYKALYTKVGRLVHIQLYIAYSAGSSTNAFQMDGLPFTVATDNYSVQVVDFGRGGFKGAYSRTHTNNTFLEFLRSSEATNSDRITVKGNQIGSGYIIYSNTYQAA